MLNLPQVAVSYPICGFSAGRLENFSFRTVGKIRYELPVENTQKKKKNTALPLLKASHPRKKGIINMPCPYSYSRVFIN
jgi:hypothetical protein